MPRRTPKLLEDIRDASSYILDVTAGKTFAMYAEDRMLRQAVERNFEIIGEAMRRLTQHDPRTAKGISRPAEVIAFRNVLTHGYDDVDAALVWHVVESNVPLLLREVELLLQDWQDG